MMKMKDSGIEWIGEIPVNWSLIKGKYIFVQRNQKGNHIELQLLSPTQNYGVIPQWKYEKLSGMVAVKLNEKADLMQFKQFTKAIFVLVYVAFKAVLSILNMKVLFLLHIKCSILLQIFMTDIINIYLKIEVSLKKSTHTL